MVCGHYCLFHRNDNLTIFCFGSKENFSIYLRFFNLMEKKKARLDKIISDDLKFKHFVLLLVMRIKNFTDKTCFLVNYGSYLFHFSPSNQIHHCTLFAAIILAAIFLFSRKAENISIQKHFQRVLATNKAHWRVGWFLKIQIGYHY